MMMQWVSDSFNVSQGHITYHCSHTPLDDVTEQSGDSVADQTIPFRIDDSHQPHHPIQNRYHSWRCVDASATAPNESQHERYGYGHWHIASPVICVRRPVGSLNTSSWARSTRLHTSVCRKHVPHIQRKR